MIDRSESQILLPLPYLHLLSPASPTCLPFAEAMLSKYRGRQVQGIPIFSITLFVLASFLPPLVAGTKSPSSLTLTAPSMYTDSGLYSKAVSRNTSLLTATPRVRSSPSLFAMSTCFGRAPHHSSQPA